MWSYYNRGNCYDICRWKLWFITDPYSEDAERHAEMYYEEIRHLSTDVERIAQNTGMSVDQIALVKNYLCEQAQP